MIADPIGFYVPQSIAQGSVQILTSEAKDVPPKPPLGFGQRETQADRKAMLRRLRAKRKR